MSVLTQVGHVKTNLTMFLFCLCVIFSCQVNASLLDPTLIGKELQKFARDALGVDEMQVRQFINCLWFPLEKYIGLARGE